MGFENVGKVWTPQQLASYLESIERPAWCRAVTLHHTGVPSLADRPNGFSAKQLGNLQSFYESRGWTSGPHLFVDEDQAWGMCDFREFGIHAYDWNWQAIGIEVLGNYSQESPLTGRGAACWRTAAATTRVLLDWLGLEPVYGNLWIHREEEETIRQGGTECPGLLVERSWIVERVRSVEPQQPRMPSPNAPQPSPW